MGGVGDTKMLQSACDTLPWLAVVQPGGQPVQVRPPGAGYMPREQMQSACDTLPWLAVVMPGGQPVQGMPPEAFLYMPTGQGVQPNVVGTCPALHEVFPTIAQNIMITTSGGHEPVPLPVVA